MRPLTMKIPKPQNPNYVDLILSKGFIGNLVTKAKRSRKSQIELDFLKISRKSFIPNLNTTHGIPRRVYPKFKHNSQNSTKGHLRMNSLTSKIHSIPRHGHLPKFYEVSNIAINSIKWSFTELFIFQFKTPRFTNGLIP